MWNLPNIVPLFAWILREQGFYAVKMEAKNQNKREIFCVQTNMTIGYAKNWMWKKLLYTSVL